MYLWSFWLFSLGVVLVGDGILCVYKIKIYLLSPIGKPKLLLNLKLLRQRSNGPILV